MDARKKHLQKGQATFEFLIFLPFLLIFIGAFVTISGAINGAINQEKATRGYFYRRIKGNAYIIEQGEVKELGEFKTIGNMIIGFRERSKGKASILPCYKLKMFLTGTIDEDCEKPSGDLAGSTFLLKVGTIYGMCSATYTQKTDGSGYEQSFESSATGICQVK